MEQEQPFTFNNDYRSQIMEEAKVEAILLENPKEREPNLLEIQMMEIQEEEEVEEGRSPGPRCSRSSPPKS